MDIQTFLFMQAIASTVVVISAQFVLEGCMEMTKNEESKTANLSCGNGIIYSVNVQSRTSSCKKSKGGCSGKTPSLLVNQIKCHWHRDCVINWPSDPIIVSDSDELCLGEHPTSVWVSYKCFRPTDYVIEGSRSVDAAAADSSRILLMDICSDMRNGSSMYARSADTKLSGVIRSHSIYPWGYTAKRRNCTVKINWPESQKLIVTVHNIALDEDDYLTIGNKNPVNVTSAGNIPLEKEELTVFNFIVGNETNGGQGFVVCFKFIPDKEDEITDVCEAITTDGSVAVSGNKSTETAQEIPKRCQKKKSERAKKRCVARTASRHRKNKEKGTKKNRNGKPKGKKRKNKKKSRKREKNE